MSDISLKAKLEDRGITDEISAETAEKFRVAVGNLAKAAQNEWITRAQSRLESSREIYVNGLRQAESFKVVTGLLSDTYELQLVGEMPNNLEFGMPAFDMKAVKPGWLGGKKAKVGKDGSRYVTIPFRHSTGNSPRFAYTGKAKAADMKTLLRKAVKDYGMNRWGIGPGGAIPPMKRIPNNAPVHQYLKGLTRIEKPTSGRTSTGVQRRSSMFMTWRRMSDKSAPSSWIHPGLTAANILPEIETWADEQLDKIIDTVIGSGI